MPEGQIEQKESEFDGAGGALFWRGRVRLARYGRRGRPPSAFNALPKGIGTMLREAPTLARALASNSVSALPCASARAALPKGIGTMLPSVLSSMPWRVLCAFTRHFINALPKGTLAPNASAGVGTMCTCLREHDRLARSTGWVLNFAQPAFRGERQNP